jgi:hypothetical protein
MRIHLSSLTLKCKKEIIEIPFSKSITYFYGRMGAGKSTIPMLIDFCLGNELIETPALQKEFLLSQLKMQVGDYHLTLTREVHSNQILVEWKDIHSNESYRVVAPVKAEEDKYIIKGTDIQTISDLLFYLSGFKPPLVKRSKLIENSPLIRLSFRDVMWYSYLDQEEIDSSFFYLEEGGHEYKKYKSRDVLRLFLGYHHESIAQLESDLANARRQWYAVTGAAKQLKNFLDENKIGDVATLQEEIENTKMKITETITERENIKRGIARQNGHVVEEIREKAKSLNSLVSEYENALSDLSTQIIQRKRLLGEYEISNIKANRTLLAKELFKEEPFVTCPQCGLSIQKRLNHNEETHNCSLCLQPVIEELEDMDIISADIKARIKEIGDSIERLEVKRDLLTKEHLELKEEKVKVDKHLNEVEKDYDSAYLASIKDLDRKIGEYGAKRDSIARLMPLPMKINELYDKANNLKIAGENLKRELDEAKAKAEKEAQDIELLKQLFLDCLTQVNFPGMSGSDAIMLNTSTFFPRVVSKDNDIFEMNFSNLGSGGKKTIFKCCFAIAVHRLAARKNIPLPTFLIIDTPMKNISERENKDIFDGFYKFVYKLLSEELTEMQMIIVDKEFYSFDDYKGEDEPISRHMTPDDPQFPPLIPYYMHGH